MLIVYGMGTKTVEEKGQVVMVDVPDSYDMENFDIANFTPNGVAEIPLLRHVEPERGEDHSDVSDFRKVVINTCYGGFLISDKAFELLCSTKSENPDDGDPFRFDADISRADPALVRVVETLKEEANGLYSALKVVEVPIGVEWTIQEYDGMEWVAEKHQTWQ
jgi:hypothetical protein